MSLAAVAVRSRVRAPATERTGGEVAEPAPIGSIMSAQTRRGADRLFDSLSILTSV